MKRFVIDIETLDGCAVDGNFLSFRGNMTVREDTSILLDGVHQSTLSMSVKQAAALQRLLTQVLKDIIAANRNREG